MELQRHPDGHTLIGGARWHYPRQGAPDRCAVPGCTRELGQQVVIEDDDNEEDLDDCGHEARTA